MKLINQLTILKKNLRDIDYVNRKKLIFEKEYNDHTTQKHCLV